MGMITITPEDYATDHDKRAIAEALAAWAKVDLRDVAHIDQVDGGWRIKVLRKWRGKRFISRGQIAHRWIRLKEPSASDGGAS